MKIWIILIFVVCISIEAIGQKNVIITQGPSISALMAKFAKNGKSVDNVKGWRIQLVNTDDRRQMEQAQAAFEAMYPGEPVDWKHVAPYYQLRVGFFDSKTKMMPMFLELKKTYPAATFIYDQISKRALVN